MWAPLHVSWPPCPIYQQRLCSCYQHLATFCFTSRKIIHCISWKIYCTGDRWNVVLWVHNSSLKEIHKIQFLSHQTWNIFLSWRGWKMREIEKKYSPASLQFSVPAMKPRKEVDVGKGEKNTQLLIGCLKTKLLILPTCSNYLRFP